MINRNSLNEIASVVSYLRKADLSFRLVFLTVVLSILLVLINLYLILLLFPLVNGIISGDFKEVTRMTFVGEFFRFFPGWAESNRAQLFILTTWICVVALVRSFASFQVSLVVRREATAAARHLRAALFQRFQKFGKRYFEKQGDSDLIDQFISGTSWITVVSVGFQQLVTDVLLAILYFAVAIYISWELTATLFVVVPPLILFSESIRSSLSRSSIDSTRISTELYKKASDVLGRLVFLKETGRIESEGKRLLELSEREIAQKEHAFKCHQMLNPLHEISVTAANLLMGWAISLLYWPGVGNGAELFVFFFLVTRFVPIINSIGRFRVTVASQRGAMELFDRVMSDEGKYISHFGTHTFPKDLQNIEVRAVSFGYLENRFVLCNLNLTILKGQSVLVTGRSGSGKSTLARLLKRHYDPAAGSIRVNELNIADFSQESFQSSVHLVEQKPIVLNATLRENICGGWSRVFDPRALSNAIEAARLGPLLERLPEGLDSLLGEGGAQLSGGESQQLAVARALYARPQFLILDEPTSSLDFETCRALLQGIRKGYSMTILMISHQPIAKEFADRILVMHDGRLYEENRSELTVGG